MVNNVIDITNMLRNDEELTIEDKIENEVLTPFYDEADDRDSYKRILDRALHIYDTDIVENNVEISRIPHERFIIAIMDIANQIEETNTTRRFLNIANEIIKSPIKKYRVKLSEAQMMVIEGNYNDSILIYNEVEDHYKKIGDDCMIGVIEYHKGLYFKDSSSLIIALNKYIEIYDNSERATERVEDTYNQLIKLSLSDEEKFELRRLENKITALGIAV